MAFSNFHGHKLSVNKKRLLFSLNDRKQLHCYYFCRCTNIIGSPSLYVDLIANAKKLDITLTTLRVGSVGGSLCTKEIVQGMLDTLNIKRVCVSEGDLLFRVF